MRQSRPCHENLLVWVLIALGLALGSQTCLSYAQSEVEIPPVVMTLEVNRSTYWLGEPVVAVARIYNWYSPEIRIYSAYGFQGVSDLRIAHENVMSDRYRAHFPAAPVTEKNLGLPYGKAFEFRMVVVYDSGRPGDLALYEPGTYRFALNQPLEYSNSFAGDTGRTRYAATAETGDIKVVEPPLEGRAAFDLLVSTPGAVLSLSSLMAMASTRDVLEKIAREYPESRYAPYCLHAVGSYALTQVAADTKEIERAEWAYKRIMETYPNYPLLTEVRLHLAKLYLTTGRINDGASLADQTLASSPDNLYRFRDWDPLMPYIGSLKGVDVRVEENQWQLFDTAQLPNALVQAASEPRADRPKE